MNRLTLKTCVQVLCGHKFLIHLGKYQRSVNEVLYNRNMFNFARTHQTAFQYGCSVVLLNQGIQVPVAPQACQLLVVCFRMLPF